MFSFRYECLSMSGWWASDHMGQTYFYRLIDVSICWPIAIKKTMFPNGPKLTAITFCDRKETSLRAMPMATIEKYLVVFRSGTTSTWRGTNLNMTTSLTSASLQNTSGNRICWCITGEFLNPSIKKWKACLAWLAHTWKSRKYVGVSELVSCCYHYCIQF